MSELILRGLDGASPLAAMAAMGLLCRLTQEGKWEGLRLGWKAGAPFHPYLQTAMQLDENGLLKHLAATQAERVIELKATLGEGNEVKVSQETFHAIVSERCMETNASTRCRSDFWMAMGSDLVTDKTKVKNVKPTALYMGSGQQKFASMVNDLGEYTVKDMFKEALFGPWRYKDKIPAFHWDPAMEREHALQAVKPSVDKAKGVAAAHWLAVEGLFLFPVAAVQGRLLTTCFDQKSECFSWPIWERPLTLDGLRSLLHLAELQDAASKKRNLQGRGVVAVYRSQRSTFGQGYGMFNYAERII